MHYKIIGGGLGFSENGLKNKKRSRFGGFHNHNEIDDDDESNMTDVGYDHIPLMPGLSHIVRLELGSNPLVLGPERKVSDVEDDYELSSSTSNNNPSSHKDDGPAEVRPLYKEEPTISIEPKTPNRLTLQRLQQTENPMLLYNTKRSKDILQLQLAMQKQTEFDEQNRDMDHRLHCINKPSSTPTSTSGRTRSRSRSPNVPEIIDLSSPDEPPHGQEPSSRKRKSPPPPITIPTFAAAAGINEVITPTSSRGSPILLQSTFVRRPHKNKRANSKAQPEKAKPSKASKSATKKQKTSGGGSSNSNNNSNNNTDEDDEDHRFKRFQNTQWHQKFQELLTFRKVNGHCQVPHTWPPNPQLARWVKRQRYQFKLRCEGKLSTMTEDRVQLLNEVGFVWDSHAAAWQEKYEELKDYVQTYKTFNMGNSYATHPQLATWVKCQRRQYKLLMMGQESNMTEERKELLEQLGFLWGVRGNQPGGSGKNSPK